MCYSSLRAHLHVLEVLWVSFKDTNQPSLPTPFYSVVVSVSIFITLLTVFHRRNFPDNSPHSHSALPVYFGRIGPFNYISLYERLLQP